MILEPQFPPDFVQLVSTIVRREVEIDQAKARIDQKDSEALFEAIDHLRCGEIFVQDLYAYLKRNGLVLSKKDLKFVNRYFGFSSHEKLDFQLFKANFLQCKSQQATNLSQQCHSQQALIALIKKALDSYNEIEQLRVKIADNISELQASFRTYYPDHPYFLTKTSLLEILSCLKMYSRLNYKLLCNYIIGEEVNQVSLKQVFWKQQTNNYMQITNSQAYPFGQVTAPEYEARSKKKSDDMDILQQIENIESAYTIKKHQLADRTKISEYANKRQCRVDDKRQRISQANLGLLAKRKVLQRDQTQGTQPRNSWLASSKEKKYAKDIDEILKRSIDGENDDIEENQKQIERLYNNRRLSKSRQEALSRASSSAKLRIQEIQKKILLKSKTSNHHSGLRTPISIPISQELRSKFASLAKK